MTDTPNVLMHFIHVHHSMHKPCLWIAKAAKSSKRDGELFFTDNALLAHAFRLDELTQANDFIVSRYAPNVTIRIFPMNCATIECFTPAMKQLLNL